MHWKWNGDDLEWNGNGMEMEQKMIQNGVVMIQNEKKRCTKLPHAWREWPWHCWTSLAKRHAESQSHKIVKIISKDLPNTIKDYFFWTLFLMQC